MQGQIVKQRRKTVYEKAVDTARSYGFEGDDVKRVAKHIFAKALAGGATIGRTNGRLVISKSK